MVAVPKPTPAAPREPKRLQSKPRLVDRSAAAETFTRDGYLCQWCLRPGGRLVPHHRFRRSQGGRDRAALMVSVHVLCHDAIHTTHVAEAKRRRFLVRSEDECRLPWLAADPAASVGEL